MVKEPIRWKVAGFNYVLEPSLDEETNTLRVGNNAINCDSCSVDNS